MTFPEQLRADKWLSKSEKSKLATLGKRLEELEAKKSEIAVKVCEIIGFSVPDDGFYCDEWAEILTSSDPVPVALVDYAAKIRAKWRMEELRKEAEEIENTLKK
jgi:hypothetical protein